MLQYDAQENKGIVRKDKVNSGYHGNMKNFIVFNSAGDTQVEITNGVFVVDAGAIEGQREVRKGTLATEADIGKEVYLIHNPEVQADEKKRKGEFVIKAGKVARGYSLTHGDIITLTSDLFDGTPAVDDTYAVKLDGKIGAVTTIADAKISFNVFENVGDELALYTEGFAVEIQRN